MKTARPLVLFAIFLILAPAGAQAEYSNWSFGAGLDLVYNADNSVKKTTDGSPQGFQSGPSPIAGYIAGEYRQPLKYNLNFAPSASIMFFQYLWAYDRALPAEIENRTAFVPTLFLEMPFLYGIESGRFDFSFGLGPGILIRYGFLESGVSADEKSYDKDMPAGEQVKQINNYLWAQSRWFCPTVQAGVRYKLETGWGANFVFKTGIPLSNLWSTPTVPFVDSFMFMASILITPPAPKSATPGAAPATPESAALPDTPEPSATK